MENLNKRMLLYKPCKFINLKIKSSNLIGNQHKYTMYKNMFTTMDYDETWGLVYEHGYDKKYILLTGQGSNINKIKSMLQQFT